MLQRLLKYLGSLRFTIIPIALLGIIFLLGLWIPQKGILQQEQYLEWQANSPRLVAFLDFLGLTDIYTSPITLTLWVLFFLNLTLVMWQRIPLVRRKVAFSDNKLEDPCAAAGYPFRSTIELPAGVTPEAVPGLFSRAGYRFYGTAGSFYAVKNRFAPVASLLFHLSFFLILLGGVVSKYSRFIGNLDIAQGESFHGEPERYASISLPKIGTPPEIAFRVVSIAPEVERDTPTALKVRIQDERGGFHVADINRPYKRGRTSLVIKNLGVAPLVVMLDSSGRELDGAYVKLDVLKGKQDSFQMGGYRFTALFYPDYFVKDGVEGSRSEEFRNPVFRLTVERDGKAVVQKTIRPGESVSFDDYVLTVREMPFWVRFVVVKEYGLEVIYTGFVLATLGLVWRLLFYRREMVGAVRTLDGKRMIHMAGRSEFYRSLAEDEFQRLVASFGRKNPFDEEKA